VLIWPGWRNLPKSLRALENDPEALRKQVRSHIGELASRLRGKLEHWDVMNEPFDTFDLMKILGEQEMFEWFKIARAADPGAKLFINDYAILSGGGGDTPHRDHYERTIEFLSKKGAPLDGIGLQGHFGSTLTSPGDLLALLDRFARFKKSLYVTEYDIDIDDEAVARRYTEDFYTTLFSHPQVDGIVMWGFWDSVHWKKNAPMYRADWSLKPSGEVLRELLTRRWRTHESGVTDSRGEFKVRGFLGDYRLTAGSGSQEMSSTVSLPKRGATVVLK
jgi:GH35 family endo-1,4-beta-xylanase